MREEMEFVFKSQGATAQQAFEASFAVRYKEDFITIPLPPAEDPYQMASRLIGKEDARVSDVEGPAGCIDITSTTYGITTQCEAADRVFLFFGWLRQ